ncbi:MAG: hypothetical protein A2Y92_02650 [Chloroflexi bacterium RBG_13_57_8]|nr:MAG: hypothetical protein A2Y92_02650 [Chloroflexi bacterium RBG_13_57_8]
MIKKILFSTLVLDILALSVWWVHDTDVLLLLSAPWALAAAAALGTALGITRAVFSARARGDGKTERHSVDAFLEHWGTAAGIFILIISGYWMGSGGMFARNLHFLGILVTLFFGGYFLADFFITKKHAALLPDSRDITGGTLGKYCLGNCWRESGKYLSSQKSAFLVFAILGSEILFTGAVKAAAFFRAVPPDVINVSTSVHDAVGMLFGVVLLVHMLLVVTVRAHRPLLGHWLRGDLAGELEPGFREEPVEEN